MNLLQLYLNLIPECGEHEFFLRADAFFASLRVYYERIPGDANCDAQIEDSSPWTLDVIGIKANFVAVTFRNRDHVKKYLKTFFSPGCRCEDFAFMHYIAASCLYPWVYWLKKDLSFSADLIRDVIFSLLDQKSSQWVVFEAYKRDKRLFWRDWDRNDPSRVDSISVAGISDEECTSPHMLT